MVLDYQCCHLCLDVVALQIVLVDWGPQTLENCDNYRLST